MMADPFRGLNHPEGHGLLMWMSCLALVPSNLAYSYNVFRAQNRDHCFRSINFLFTRDSRYLIVRIDEQTKVKLFKLDLLLFIIMRLATPLYTLSLYILYA